jgi:hypothetical protein
MAANGSLDGPTMKLRSGRTIGKWHIAQAKLRHNINMVGDSIKFDFTDPPDSRLRPMSQVFNIPELLEEILLNLGPAFLLQRVQKVCRGFRDSLEGSPTFRKRSSFAIRVDNGVTFALFPNLIPKSLVMSPRSAGSHFYFLFSGDSGPTTLESHRRMRRLRGMHMFDVCLSGFLRTGSSAIVGRVQRHGWWRMEDLRSLSGSFSMQWRRSILLIAD